MTTLRSAFVLSATLLAALPLSAQEAPEREGEAAPAIEVNGFLVEEAYNQERGLLQQIARTTFTRGGAWSGVFTQEWPVLSERHQLELAVRAARGTGLAGLGAEYRFLAVGDEEARVAVAPALELAWAREEEPGGGTESEWEVEATLPVSLRLGGNLVANFNAGVALRPGGDEGPGFRVGQGLVWRAHPRLNLLLEGVYASDEPVLGGGEEGEESLVVSPGVQLAFPLGRDVQLVPGVAFPVGVGPSEGNRGVLAYLSVEHPFGRR